MRVRSLVAIDDMVPACVSVCQPSVRCGVLCQSPPFHFPHRVRSSSSFSRRRLFPFTSLRHTRLISLNHKERRKKKEKETILCFDAVYLLLLRATRAGVTLRKCDEYGTLALGLLLSPYTCRKLHGSTPQWRLEIRKK